MRFLHVRFCSVSVRKTELSLTCSVWFGQNGKTLLWLVTRCTPSKFQDVNLSVHRGAFCQFTFQWIYYYGSNKSGHRKWKWQNAHLCIEETKLSDFESNEKEITFGKTRKCQSLRHCAVCLNWKREKTKSMLRIIVSVGTIWLLGIHYSVRNG